MRIRDPGWRQFGSGIRDGKKSDPGSGINIPDPQHCRIDLFIFFCPFWLSRIQIHRQNRIQIRTVFQVILQKHKLEKRNLSLRVWPPFVLEDQAPEERALEEEKVNEGEDMGIEAGQERAW